MFPSTTTSCGRHEPRLDHFLEVANTVGERMTNRIRQRQDRGGLGAAPREGGPGWFRRWLDLLAGVIGVVVGTGLLVHQVMRPPFGDPPANRPAVPRPPRYVAETLPGYMQPAHRVVLAEWLAKNPTFRPAVTSDMPHSEDLILLRQHNDNDQLYYIAAELNGDAHIDFAAIVVDESKRPDEAIRVLSENDAGSVDVVVDFDDY